VTGFEGASPRRSDPMGAVKNSLGVIKPGYGLERMHCVLTSTGRVYLAVAKLKSHV
jgi:hypothetical protein